MNPYDTGRQVAMGFILLAGVFLFMILLAGHTVLHGIKKVATR